MQLISVNVGLPREVTWKGKAYWQSELSDLANALLRLPLGTDTLQAIAQKNAYVEQETAAWCVLAESTNY